MKDVSMEIDSWKPANRCGINRRFRGYRYAIQEASRHSELSKSRVEKGGSNTSIIAVSVVGSDQKGTQCLGLSPGHPVTARYKYGNLASRLGESRI
jgi:hypothetical protein